jgi:hypothetical protein
LLPGIASDPGGWACPGQADPWTKSGAASRLQKSDETGEIEKNSKNSMIPTKARKKTKGFGLIF